MIKSTLDLVDFLHGKESLKKVFGSNFDVNCIEHSILILNQKNLPWICEDLDKWEKGICYLKLKDKEILYHAQNEESSVQYCEDLVSILFSMDNIFKCCLNN
ncbi:hypothetical protein [Criblamydia sequanensis]|uniref:Uncharacterized protein n=1 Tax=Candidatus Criblamydia sequanensis CRIB-18 TaxID=1437425 RepID=A0A090E1V8_9BACT|nr:hypothetical protein [Criblamydia sequanensis]CDR34704.1 hypothetical protein CSEC_1897 [Criblamydia sequanensis CRIB-18]